MSRPLSELADLLGALEPVCHDGVYVFASLPPCADLGGLVPLGSFREAEGLTVIVDEVQALHAGLRIAWRCVWITLNVPSNLEAVGLTAAVAAALEVAGVACNVIAAVHHDHLFVPIASADAAAAAPRALQRRSVQRTRPPRDHLAGSAEPAWPQMQ